MRRGIILATCLLVTSVLIAPVAVAAELFGIVYSQGTPIANLPITVKENQQKNVKTGPKGNYSIELEPGNYTLIIKGREITVTVTKSPAVNRFDIRL